MTVKNTINRESITKFSEYVFIGLLVYMPLHIFLSTWIGTTLSLLSFMKGLKDAVMIVGFLPAFALSINKPWFKGLFKKPLTWVIIVYGLLTLLLALVKPTDQGAESLGVVYNLRFLVFFVYALLLANLVSWKELRKKSLIAVFASAFVVLIFGLLQYTVLPHNLLSHVGYQRSNGVLPAFYIDDKPNLLRIASTLRDPNSLGSYLIIIGSLALALLLRRKQRRNLAIGFLALSVMCIWFTFSRSALLGFGISAAIIVIMGLKGGLVPTRWFKRIVVGMVVLLVLLGSGLFVFRNTYTVQNVIFHADQSTKLKDPNQLRLMFWRQTVDTIAHQPLGEGPGTAGLASISNKVQGTQLNENYYLQIGEEVGILGLVLFLTILVLTGKDLLEYIDTDWVALGLFAAFIGLAFTNFLVHIWSNEAVAYTWWGLAGVIVSTKLVTRQAKLVRSTNKKKSS